MRVNCAKITALCLAIALTPIFALAAAPFRTDDPEPVEYRHGELYLFSQATHVKGGAEGSSVGVDVSYGIWPETELSFVAPLEFDTENNSGTQCGYGDTETGIKYRFLKEDTKGWRPQIAISPLLVLPTGNESKGLGTGHIHAFLPLWLQKSYGSWTTYGGGGYWINPGDENKDYWFFGWVLMRKLTDKLDLGGEFFYQTADTIEAKSSAGFNLGATYDITETHHLVFAAGRGIWHANATNEFSYYAAYEFTF